MREHPDAFSQAWYFYLLYPTTTLMHIKQKQTCEWITSQTYVPEMITSGTAALFREWLSLDDHKERLWQILTRKAPRPYGTHFYHFLPLLIGLETRSHPIIDTISFFTGVAYDKGAIERCLSLPREILQRATLTDVHNMLLEQISVSNDSSVYDVDF